MNTSINYAGFIDMFLESDDDFEPYGVLPDLSEETMSAVNSTHHHEFLMANLYDT